MSEQKNNNKNLSKHDKEMYEYIDTLDDAARQRNPDHYQDSKVLAGCIVDIIKILKKYKIRKVDETIHALTSVMIIPIQILEPDPSQRNIFMRQIAQKFMNDIMSTQTKDMMMQKTEVGNELDKLRVYASASETFGTAPQKNVK